MNEKAIELLDKAKEFMKRTQLRNEKFIIEVDNNSVNFSRKKKNSWF